MSGIMETDKSISALLVEAGYRHEPLPNTGKHRIIEINTGRQAGDMWASEAVEFLQSLTA